MADAALMDAIQTAAAARGIPAPILYGMAMAEGGGKANVGNSQIAPAIGNENHTGPFQISDSMAAKYGGDRHNVYQAADMAARAISENVGHFGNLDDAVKAWHGGYNTKNWGDRTQANYAAITQNASQYPGNASAPSGSAPPASNEAPDPYLAGLPQSNSSSSAPAKDPFLDGIDGATSAPNVGVPAPSANPVRNMAASGGSGNPDSSGNRGVAGQRTWGQWLGALTPETDSVLNGGSYLADKRDQGLGFVKGVNDVINTGEHFAGGVLNHVIAPISGLFSTGAADMTRRAATRLHADADQSDADMASWGDPSNPSNDIGRLAGNLVGSAPAAGLKIFPAAAEGSGALAKALAQYGNLSLEGSAMGGLASGGHNVLANMAGGAVLAPGLGLLGSKASDLLAPKVGDLAAAIKGAFAKNAPPIAVPESGAQAGQTIASMIKNGEPDSAIQAYAAQHGYGGGVNDALAYRAQHGRYTPGVVLNKAPITPAQAQDALGSRGSNTGIASNPGLTPDVQARTDALRGQGVPDDQALAQAHIEAVGGNPTTATVTRDRELQDNVNNGAVLNTPEGKALSAQNAANNKALIDTTTGTINQYGGRVEPGEAMRGNAEKLAAESDAERVGIKSAYATARATDGNAQITPDNIKAMLTSNEAKAQIAGGGPEASLLKSVASMVKSAGSTDGTLKGALEPERIDEIMKMANRKVGPDLSVNHWVGQINKASDADLNQLDTVGAAWRAARATNRTWAEKYQDPQGVAKLIARDDKGNFVNADTWAGKDALMTSKTDPAVPQIIRALKNVDAQPELDKMRAQVVQGAYDKATSTATDQARNAVMSGKAFRAHLDSVGQNKLDALFSPEEQSHLAMIGHAASHLNEMVPKSFNSSGTATTLINALAQSKNAGAHGSSPTAKVVNGGITALGAALGHLSGLGALEGGEIGAAVTPLKLGLDAALNKRAASKSAADLAKAIQDASSPEVARASANDNAIRELAKTIAKARAGAVAGRSGAVVGQRRREGN